MDYQVVLSPSARADLRDIVRYISFDAADRALEFGRFLISRTQLLAQSPQLGRIVPEFEDASIREIIVRSYRVVYRVDDLRHLVREKFWQVPAYVQLKEFGMREFAEEQSAASVLWFDLALTDFYAHWKGRLIVGWPPPERSWWRRAHLNEIPVVAILEDSALDAALPEWDEIEFTWEQLRVLPMRLKFKLSEWRGIYYIFDTLDAKGYVGSAYGESNLLGRWLNYAARGDGGNKLLRHRNPSNFRFTILQRVSPDLASSEVIRLESSWKQRLHTRVPYGLNEN